MSLSGVKAQSTVWYVWRELAGKSPWYNNESYVDTLNRKAIERFIEVTHEKYRATVGDEFGKTVPAIFTDEPQVYGFCHLKSGFDKGDASCSITTDFFETYKKKFRRSLEASLPELFFATDSESAKSTRYNYYTHLSERFNEAYMDKCAGNGGSGHDQQMGIAALG